MVFLTYPKAAVIDENHEREPLGGLLVISHFGTNIRKINLKSYFDFHLFAVVAIMIHHASFSPSSSANKLMSLVAVESSCTTTENTFLRAETGNTFRFKQPNIKYQKRVILRSIIKYRQNYTLLEQKGMVFYIARLSLQLPLAE